MENRTTEQSTTAWYDVVFNTSSGILGMILNFWLILVTLRKNVIDGNFKIYIGNLAMADFMYAFVTFMEPIFANIIPSYNGLFCKVYI